MDCDDIKPYLTERTNENYLSTMRLYRTWGGNLELHAFSEFYRKAVEVYTESPIPQTNHVFGEAYSQASGERPNRLFFCGRHYNPLLPTDVAELILLELEAGLYETVRALYKASTPEQVKSRGEICVPPQT